ncbi:hypothetical protein N7457_000472 [Penicillium paradoxum]|uniref:uncharacterized protein n=1 Tax=Penicillium paradoxum TaxID=176176 RepID=UPI002546D4E7|nr:uncharacterized protein N7457_000472 [Penicillium paradoxum]KAJ5793873.1 hypothetical protein N7457_000472 [Penicillium paradoxum]
MTTVQSYYEQASSFDWIDAISGDNGGIDPRTFKVHQMASHRHHAESDQQESEETQSPPPSRRPSLDYLRTNFPLQLEHEPPLSRPNLNESSLFELHNQISQDYPRERSYADLLPEEDRASVTTTSTDTEYERCMLPFCGALPPPSEGSSSTTTNASSTTSSSSPGTAEPEWLPLVLGRVISSKARKTCRALKGKLSGTST